jgi:hypothetical protein
MAEKKTTGGFSGIPSTTTKTTGGFSGIPTTSNFTYGAGNPMGVPTVAKPVPTAPAPKPASPAKPAPKTPTVPTVVAPVIPVTGLTAEQIAAQLAAVQAASAANAAEVARQQAAAEVEARRRAGQSAYDLLLSEFTQYGLGSLVEPLKTLIQSGPSSSELTLALRATDAYKKRFAANPERIKKGYAALNEASYLALEDGFQDVMRNYGLPASYYSKDSMGRQAGFEILIGGNVKVPELEERIILGKNELLEAPVKTRQAFTQFFPSITEGDILGYVLNPEKGLSEIKRKVSAAQIGGAFLGTKTTSGATLTTSLGRAEELARAGVTGTTAKQVATAIGGGLERGRQLTSFYEQPAYTQAMAEEELFNLPGQTEAKEKRKKVIGLEGAEFGKRTGLTSGALSQNRAGSY